MTQREREFASLVRFLHEHRLWSFDRIAWRYLLSEEAVESIYEQAVQANIKARL